MSLLEALNLCKDGGHRVRPVCWANRVGRQGCYVEWAAWNCEYKVAIGDGGCHVSFPCSADELLGEWETVEESKS